MTGDITHLAQAYFDQHVGRRRTGLSRAYLVHGAEMNAEFACLSELVRQYFDEDYEDMFPTPVAALVQFRHDAGSDAARRTAEEFTAAADQLDEAGLVDLWSRRLYSGFVPTKDGMTYREWFQHAIDVLSEPS